MEPKAKSFHSEPRIIGDTVLYDLPLSCDVLRQVCSYSACSGLLGFSCPRPRINATGTGANTSPTANESASAATIEPSGATRTDERGTERENSGAEDRHVERPAVFYIA